MLNPAYAYVEGVKIIDFDTNLDITTQSINGNPALLKFNIEDAAIEKVAIKFNLSTASGGYYTQTVKFGAAYSNNLTSSINNIVFDHSMFFDNGSAPTII
jgi:hypothetical protein